MWIYINQQAYVLKFMFSDQPTCQLTANQSDHGESISRKTTRPNYAAADRRPMLLNAR